MSYSGVDAGHGVVAVAGELIDEVEVEVIVPDGKQREGLAPDDEPVGAEYWDGARVQANALPSFAFSDA